MSSLLRLIRTATEKNSHTVNPPGVGAHLFQAHLRGGGGLIETGDLVERWGGLSNLKTTMVSVPHKELEYKVEKLEYKTF